MTQRWSWIRFALPAMVEGRDGFRLTGGLAKPNAALERIWNTLLRSVLAAYCHLRNFFQRIDADNPSNNARAGRVIERNGRIMADFPKTLHGPKG
jgi:hypothetical protein